MLIRSLSGRLLLLTIVFVMVVEVFIFVPSVARFRVDYLQERIDRAQIASLALRAIPRDRVNMDREAELLETADVFNIVFQRDGVRETILMHDMPPPIDATFDLREDGFRRLLVDTFDCMTARGDRVIRVIGAPTVGKATVIETTLREGPLKSEMLAYGVRVLGLSLVISAVTSIFIVLAVRRFVVAPVTRVISNMQEFAADPENADRVIRPSSGITEIVAAETALADMETGLRSALRQNARLAALGEALAKVSHDLRNTLTTAQLLADRLAGSADPRSARVAPKILKALDRAIKLCQSTLDYGRVEEPAPEMRTVALRRLVDEVGESVFPDIDDLSAARGGVSFLNETPEGLTVQADPDQLHRILANLARNAREAMAGAGRPGAVRISAAAAAEGVVIDVADSGPGLPARAVENLFTPFRGGARQGGTGLGLAIAADLARAHGGGVELLRSTTEGAVFRVSLPARAALAPPVPIRRRPPESAA